MTKVGSQGANAGRANWGSRSAEGRGQGAKGSPGTQGQQAFQRVLDKGARDFKQADKGPGNGAAKGLENAASRGTQQNPRRTEVLNSLAAGERPGVGLAKHANHQANHQANQTATYDTTRIVDLGEFIQQFPEAAKAIKPILAHSGNRNAPSIAIVNSSNANSADDIQRIGNTVFMSGNAAQAAASGKLDAATIENLSAAIWNVMGS